MTPTAAGLISIALSGAFLFSFQLMPLYGEQVPPTMPQAQPNNLFAPGAPLTQPPARPVQQPSQPAPQSQPAGQPTFPMPQPQPVRPQQQPAPASQLAPVQPQFQPQQIAPQPAPPVATRPAVKRGEVSFNFDDADVFSVIQTIFGDVLKVNYIVDPSVKGRVNFRSVAPVAKEDVLPLMEVILRLNGIGVVEEGGLYRIVPIADISKEPAPVGVGRDSGKVQITGKALVQVVPVKYVQSSEMVRVLTPFLSKNAVIIDVPKSNYIIISDTDANVRRLLQLVDIFDSEALKQITPQVFVYAVQNGKAKDVAALLQQIFLGAKAPAGAAKPATTPQPRPGQPAQPPTGQPQVSMGQPTGEALVSESTRIIADEITNSIIILATPEDYALMADTLTKIDIAPRQVIIEGLIVQVTLTDNLSFGTTWSFSTDVNISGLKPFKNPINLNGDVTTGQSVDSSGNLVRPSGGGFTFVGTDPTGTVRAVISALEDQSKAKVLAAPHILVSDNREARIQVGSQIPIATSTSAQPTATTVGGVTTTTTTAVVATSTIQYKDIGIILKVKPQVNDSGLIALEISQEISSIGGSVTVGGLPEITINKIEATTNLVAQDKETIVIGGLIREDTSADKTGIPFLSRIPIIGALFGNQSNVNTRTELIILLTPRVARNQQEAREVTSDYLDRYKATTKDKDIDDFIRERSEREQGGKDAGSKAPKNSTPQP